MEGVLSRGWNGQRRGFQTRPTVCHGHGKDSHLSPSLFPLLDKGSNEIPILRSKGSPRLSSCLM